MYYSLLRSITTYVSTATISLSMLRLALLLSLRHSCKPEEEDSACDIHKDVHPQQSEVPPDVIIRDSNGAQEHIGVAK